MLKGGLSGVTFVPSFWMLETEVTPKMVAEFEKETGLTVGDKIGRKVNRPVSAPYTQIRPLCEWLSEKYGMQVVLPTEAQFEASGGRMDNRHYVKGDSPPDPRSKMLISRPYDRDLAMRGFDHTSPVGSFEEDCSVFGVYDLTMHGEVVDTRFVEKYMENNIITSSGKVTGQFIRKGVFRNWDFSVDVSPQLYKEYMAARTRLATRSLGRREFATTVPFLEAFRLAILLPDTAYTSSPSAEEVGIKDPEPPKSPEPNGGGPGSNALDFYRRLILLGD